MSIRSHVFRIKGAGEHVIIVSIRWCRYVTFAPGTMVIQQGEVGFYLALITEGDVEVCTMPRTGAKTDEKAGGVASAKSVEHDMNLLSHLLERSQAAAGKLQTMMRPHGLYCIAERHAGDILGATHHLDTSDHRLKFS